MMDAIEPTGMHLLDGHAFRNAVHTYMAAPGASFFIVRLRTADAAVSLRLAELAAEAIPAGAAGISGFFDGAVWICLRDASERNVAGCIASIRESWREAHGGEMVAASAVYPSQDSAVTQLLSAAVDSAAVTALDLLAADDEHRDEPNPLPLELKAD